MGGAAAEPKKMSTVIVPPTFNVSVSLDLMQFARDRSSAVAAFSDRLAGPAVSREDLKEYPTQNALEMVF